MKSSFTKTHLFSCPIYKIKIDPELYDKEKILKDTWDHMTSDAGLEEYLQGFIGGTGMSVGGRTIQTALRDEKANIKINEHINALSALQQAKVKSNSSEVQKSIDKKMMFL